jgi:hypothetical protein
MQCVIRVSLRLLSEIFFILRRIERDMIENVLWSACKVPVCLSDFIDSVSKNLQVSNFMQIRPVGAEFHVDGRTFIHDESNSRFSQFCERAQNWLTRILNMLQCGCIGVTSG